MTRRARRILITSLVLVVAMVIVALAFTGKGRPSRQTAAQNQTAPVPTDNAPAITPETAPPDGAAADSLAEGSSAEVSPAESNAPAATVPAATTPAAPIAGLQAIAAGNDLSPRNEAPQSLGSLDPRVAMMRVEMSRLGASVARISFTDIWETADARRQADRYRKSLQPGEAYDSTLVDESQRYVLGNLGRAQFIIVNGTQVNLQSEDVWSETAPGKFETRIVDGENQPLLEVSRQFILGPTYDIALQQKIRNVSGQPIDVRWMQFGPTDLQEDTTGYIMRRRFAFGYLPDPVRQPDLVLTGDYNYDRSDILKIHKNSLGAPADQRVKIRTLWPNDASRTQAYDLSWFASMNRYFSVGVHPSADDVARGIHSLKHVVEEITFDVASVSPDNLIYSTLHSPAFTLPPGGERSLDLALYAGPLDRHVLAQEPFVSLAMREMILYSMGGCCTFLTFQWLAKFLLNFLSLLHGYVVFDWGVSIMLLVVVVRILLHPLTKKSQINMQRFGRQMQAMKPELDKLQKKYGSDKKRMQMEQMKLMREHNINPLQMVGCLPMFLQMPIWIALWAMLYLAFDIRHQPAFYGIFQMLGDWQFLGDLSSPDHFWMLPGGGFMIPFVGVNINALNVLPLLLGVVFYIQQKYMSPPPSPNTTPEQLQQQKIMKVMMVVMMPVFLYKAPSGLTLYIFTSTCIGIMESKYIRAHIDELMKDKPASGDGEGGLALPRDKPPKKPKDSLGRMWAEKLEAARAKAAAKRNEPPKSFKKRK